jgi:trimethylamine--corrinoid protein Co-methyltransferase
MRPTLKLLDDALMSRIVDEARDVLCTIGVEIHNPAVLEMLSGHGADVDVVAARARLTPGILDAALASSPSEFRLYDTEGRQTHHFAGDNVYFAPGSAAITVLDGDSRTVRPPETPDYVRYAKLVSGLDHIASQSTAMVPADVPEQISDSYRLFLSLMYCAKPVITGAFTIEAFEIMKELQLAVRGSRSELEAKPLTVFSCCPTSPIKWSDVTSQNVVDCARWGIPVEFIAMPLSGFMAPVTVVGTLVQHTAETLSGIVISQLTRPGAPMLYGGSPAIFDIRYETTPMGAIETMMVICGYSQIGSWLGLPTQGYIGLSDSKLLDAQSGLESGMGATLAALVGINSVSGPGMLDFESCFSLEKLIVDNEICGMAARLLAGIEPRDDFPAGPLLQELMREKHLLIADHTMAHLRHEIAFPGPVIDRANRSRWLDEGGRTLGDRAGAEAQRIIESWRPPPISEDVRVELARLMTGEAATWGMDRLPDRVE